MLTSQFQNFQSMFLYFDAESQMAQNMWLDDPTRAPGALLFAFRSREQR